MTRSLLSDSHSKAPIYPAYCNHLSPTNLGKIWCPLFAADIHSLRQEPGYDGQNIYFHINHPIKFVYLTALVIDVCSPGKYIVITLDDSSGDAIDAVFPFPPSAQIENGNNLATASTEEKQEQAQIPEFVEFDSVNLDTNIGKTVKIKGTLSMFRGRMQINLRRYWVLEDTNAEVQFWARVVEFKRKVWGKAWVLSEEQVRECREEREAKEMEAQEREAQERREKRRRRRKIALEKPPTLENISRGKPAPSGTKPAKAPRDPAGLSSAGEETKVQSRSGDWICPSCGANNYRSAKRTQCFGCGTSRPPSEADDKPIKKSVDSTRQVNPKESKFQVKPGDWTCPSCGKNNYARLTECYKCHTSRLTNQPKAPMTEEKVREGSKSQTKPGDWTCPSCSANNYARQTKCFRCSTEPAQKRKFQVRPGDWTCPSCGENNFARLMRCFKCTTSRPAKAEGKG